MNLKAIRLRYYKNFLGSAEAKTLLLHLSDSSKVAWETEEFKIFGKKVLAPRSLSWFGDLGVNYRYTGLDHVWSGWPDWLDKLKGKIQKTTKEKFNFVLMNRYEDGKQYMGWHRDNERGWSTAIASLSLGAERRFLLEESSTDERLALKLEHGSLICFDGSMRHCLPKTKADVGFRINLTFRAIAPC